MSNPKLLNPTIPQGGVLAKILVNSREAYFSQNRDSDIFTILISQIDDLLDYHFQKMDNRLSFFESLTKGFKQEKSEPGFWGGILKQSEGILEVTVESAISSTLLALLKANDAVAYPAQGSANPAKIIRLLKYSKFLKGVPIIELVSLATDILSIHKNHLQELEKLRRSEQAKKILNFAKFISDQRSRLVAQKLLSASNIKKDIFQAKSQGSERAYFWIISMLRMLGLNNLDHNLYRSFDRIILNGVLNSFGVKTIIKGEIDSNEHPWLQSISFSNTSLQPLYNAFALLDYSLFDVLFFATMAAGGKLPEITVIVAFPSLNDDSIEIILTEHYPTNMSVSGSRIRKQYNQNFGIHIRGSSGKAKFFWYMIQLGFLSKDQIVDRTKYNFYLPLILSTAKFKSLQQDQVKFYNKHGLDILELEDGYVSN